MVVLLAASVSCTGADQESWVDALKPTGTEDLDLGEVGNLLTDSPTSPTRGGCLSGIDEQKTESPTSTAPASGLERGVDNHPYTATGARQLPGPDMTAHSPPEEPVTVVVARPADPDEHIAARQPEGVVTGPVPEPKLIAVGASLTSSQDESESPDADPSPCDADAAP